MNVPLMYAPIKVNDNSFVIPSYFPLPGLGVIAINAFLIRGQEPVLIDTGFAGLSEDFMKSLESLIDIADLQWIFITHADPDHIGNLRSVLEKAPNARIVTTYLGMGKMGLQGLPLDRVYLLNPGQSLQLKDRELLAIKPPVYDAPESTALFDKATGILYSSDSFGAVLQEPADMANAVAPDALRDGMIFWASVDSPWLSLIDESRFIQSLEAMKDLNPSWILSAHLAPAQDLYARLATNITGALKVETFVGPDQAAFQQMMQQNG